MLAAGTLSIKRSWWFSFKHLPYMPLHLRSCSHRLVLLLQHQVKQGLSSPCYPRAAQLWREVGLENPCKGPSSLSCGHIPSQESERDKQRIRRRLTQVKPNSRSLMGHTPHQTNPIFRLGFFLEGEMYAATLLSLLPSYLRFLPSNF